MLAARRPDVLIVSMNRKPAEQQKQVDTETSKFENVRFVQGDALRPETYPEDLKDADAVIHTVGSLIEGVNYQDFLRNGMSAITQGKFNPMEALFNYRKTTQKDYEESLEAKNRDACKFIADAYNKHCAQRKTKGHFVFLSAEQVAGPILQHYLDMKREAENYLLYHCQNIEPIILRPAFVWHENERGWSVPLAIATDIGYGIRKNIVENLPGGNLVSGLLPPASSIHLSTLSEYAIHGALGQLDGKNSTHIWTNETMNNKKEI